MITLQNSRNAEVTVLTNNFIDNYMPGANGEFVKVYIYLLRLLSDTSVPFSLEQMLIISSVQNVTLSAL